MYTPPKKQDERVACLWLMKLGIKLVKLGKPQADYLGIPAIASYKPARCC